MRTRYFHRVAKETPTRLWINNPSGEDMELAIAAGAINCTTNPAYCAKLLESDPDYIRGVIDNVIERTGDNEVAAVRVYQEAARRVMARFLPLYEQSSGRHGYVTIQDDPRADEDPPAIIQAALRNRTLGKNFMAKIPVTGAGLKAVEAMVAEDIPICATEVFSMAQAIRICDLYQSTIEKTGKRPPFYVTHITGIFDEYLGKTAKREGIKVSPEVLAQAGCAVARKEYRILKERGYQTTMLGAGARGTHHFTELVGGDVHITINWSTAQELIEADSPLVSRIDVETPQSVIDELSEKFIDFRKAFYEDALSVKEFAGYGPVQHFRNVFLRGCYLLLAEITARRNSVSSARPASDETVGNLNGQVAMVTGGATGIGAAIVERLASLGARVACCYNKSRTAAESLAEKLNREAKCVFPVKVDVSDSDQVKSAVESIAEYFGDSINILVNNAGDIIETVPVESMEEKLWEKVMDLNLKGVFLCSKYCIPGMKEKQYGRIINISSLAARAGGGPGSIPYATSKGGVETFTRGLAKELGSFNITVNAVAPGVINTAMLQRYDVTGNLENLKKMIPLARIGVPKEIAGPVAFLASKDASYITGQVISVNGGLRMD